MTPAEIAWVCHEANRAYCETIGDDSQPPWDEASTWQRTSAVNGVLYRLNQPDTTAEQQHEAWLKEKEEQGWKYGPEKDVNKLTHPCIRPYKDLPVSQQRKDRLFAAIVTALKE